jgi:Ca2+-binding EF-hand superfamily protein
MMNTLSQDKIDEIKENFEHFDSDNDGTIDFNEFSKLMQALGAGATDDEARKAGFDIVDSDDNGHIDLEEFIAWWSER